MCKVPSASNMIMPWVLKDVQPEITPRKWGSRCSWIDLLSLSLAINEYDLLMQYLGRTGRRNKTVLCVLWSLLQAGHRGSGRQMFLQSENIQDTVHKSPVPVKVNTVPAVVTKSNIPQLCRVRMKLSMERSGNPEKDLVRFRLEIGCKFLSATIFSHWKNLRVSPHFKVSNQSWDCEPFCLTLGVFYMDLCSWAGHPDFCQI